MNEQSQNDHDLLIELKAGMKSMLAFQDEFKSNILPRLHDLENKKLDRTENTSIDTATNARTQAALEDHEKRIRKNEWNRIFIWGALTIISFIIAVISHILKIY